jgi:NAD(P)-dependent dehydrogenase (short-subunit alcohol dehydrogenase family)
VAPEHPLAGIPAVVTGASRGIGAATARALAGRGAPVAVVSRHNGEEAAKVVAGIEADGGRAVAVACDVAAWDDVDRMVATVEDAFGAPVGILVNNAGIHRAGRVHRLPLEDWDAVISVDLTGAFLCTRRVVPGMIARQFGRIVNISSVIGVNGFPGDCAYAAAKAGLLGFTRALALELAPSGITVNALAPGFVETDMTRALSGNVAARTTEAVPLGRQATSDEIAEAVVFLTAGPAYVTGSTLTVDGGWTLA